MNNIIDWFYGQIIGFLGNFFAEMGNMGTELFDLDWVQAIVLFFSQLGWALFGVSLVVCIFEFGVEYSTGRADIQQTAINILKGFLSVCLFTTVPVRLYTLSVSLQGTFSAGLTGYGSSIGTIGEGILDDLSSVESITEMAGESLSFGLSVITSPINISVVELCFRGGALPADTPVEYREHIQEMRESFSQLDTLIAQANEMAEGEDSLDATRIKAIFYALYFGADDPESQASQAFLDCFVTCLLYTSPSPRD